MEVFGMAGLFGLILGFMFGVGCAFAVLYTIYMGGYRSALRETAAPEPPARLLRERKRLKLDPPA